MNFKRTNKTSAILKIKEVKKFNKHKVLKKVLILLFFLNYRHIYVLSSLLINLQKY